MIPTQIFLPFLGILFTKKFTNTNGVARTKLSYNAQMLLIKLLYLPRIKYSKADLAQRLQLNPVYVTRATKELLDMGLISEYKEGRSVFVERENSSEELFDSAKQLFVSPISKVIYVKKNKRLQEYPIASDYALSEISMINPSDVPVYACWKKDALVNDVKGLKIALPKEFIGEGINEEVKEAILAVAKKYEELGATVEEVSLDVGNLAIADYYIIADAEASSNLGRFDGIRYGYRTENFENLQDIYRNSRSEGFGPEVKRRIMLGTYVLSSGYYDAYYKKAQKVRTFIRNAYDEVFKTHDIVLIPTSPTTAFKIGEKSDNPLEMYLADICTVSVNIAGLPGMNVPCALDSNGLPIGFLLIGKAFDEETMFKAAYTYEQNTNFRENKPTFKGGDK
jgi:DNA-binding MarR family transcriptional regulator